MGHGRDEMNVLSRARLLKLFLRQSPNLSTNINGKSNRAGFLRLLNFASSGVNQLSSSLSGLLAILSTKMCFPFSQHDYELEPPLMTRRVRTHRTTRKTRCSRRVSVVTTVESVPLEYIWSSEGGYWVLHTKV